MNVKKVICTFCNICLNNFTKNVNAASFLDKIIPKESNISKKKTNIDEKNVKSQERKVKKFKNS